MAKKFDGGKPMLSLIEKEFTEELALVLQYGAEKYGMHNWRQGMTYSRLVSAAMRHLTAWNANESTDPETGLSHLAHCAASLMFLLHYERHGLGTDDRYKEKVTRKEDAGPVERKKQQLTGRIVGGHVPTVGIPEDMRRDGIVFPGNLMGYPSRQNETMPYSEARAIYEGGVVRPLGAPAKGTVSVEAPKIVQSANDSIWMNQNKVVKPRVLTPEEFGKLMGPDPSETGVSGFGRQVSQSFSFGQSVQAHDHGAGEGASAAEDGALDTEE